MEALLCRLVPKPADANDNNSVCQLMDFGTAKVWLEQTPLVRAKPNSALATGTGQCHSPNFTFVSIFLMQGSPLNIRRQINDL